MKKRFTVIFIAIAALICVMFTACFTEHEVTDTRREPWGYPNPFTGTIEGSASGHGGPVRVTMTLENGLITVVDFDFRFETDMFAGRLPGILRPIIIRTNNFDFPDRTAGATITTMAVKEAARQALSGDPNGPQVPRDELGF